MSKYTERIKMLTLPAVPLRGLVAYPGIPISLEVTGELAMHACEAANDAGSQIYLVTQKDIAQDAPTPEDLFGIGTVAKIKSYVKLPEGSVRVVAEGLCRATTSSMAERDGMLVADVLCKTVNVEIAGTVKADALIREVMKTFEEFVKLLPKPSTELVLAVKSIQSPGLLADYIACSVLVNYNDKQEILAEFEPLRRLELLAVLMEREIQLLETEMNIHKRVRAQIEQNQKEYYLREQIKVIQNELGGEAADADTEIDEYYDKVYAAHLPAEVEKKLIKEIGKLAKTPYSSAESSVIRNYLDTCLEIPWEKMSRDRVNIETAKKILDRDHDGLEKVKERVLEYLAVRQLTPDLKNQIICLVGPPGVGKTSIAASVAHAMNRKYVRVSLGGVRDEADIRGHRKTYIASMPGRIVNALVQAGTRNPLIVLDEIDKLTADAHGDPASALLEVLDSEQNKSFRDHFIEMPVDLSECMFIATANTLSTVPRPLIDRMEVIELSTYTRNEKVAIAKNHLIPKQQKRHGLNRRMMKLDDAGLIELIDYYTHEAGVRNLEREIASLCRKTAKKLVESGESVVKITAKNLHEFLGPRKSLPDVVDTAEGAGEIGVVNGLAYTEVGGDLLKVEVMSMEGTGKLELTGSLGDVMKESAHLAVSYIRAHAKELGINPDFYKNRDLHIHFPEGAVPKDGPSAGVTITTALASELSGMPARSCIAMTGEISLHGRVLAIGGLKEKTMAAYKAGVKTILIPKDNERDLDEIDRIVRENTEFVLCSHIDEVLKRTLIGYGEVKLKVACIPCECREENDAIITMIPEIPDTKGVSDSVTVR
ncbi:MAG: endopeptidase La [Clostridia bacterium]|nr:endopeptidase La [Clostridia bacterium]